jgi:hypothetical protein
VLRLAEYCTRFVAPAGSEPFPKLEKIAWDVTSCIAVAHRMLVLAAVSVQYAAYGVPTRHGRSQVMVPGNRSSAAYGQRASGRPRQRRRADSRD